MTMMAQKSETQARQGDRNLQHDYLTSATWLRVCRQCRLGQQSIFGSAYTLDLFSDQGLNRRFCLIASVLGLAP